MPTRTFMLWRVWKRWQRESEYDTEIPPKIQGTIFFLCTGNKHHHGRCTVCTAELHFGCGLDLDWMCGIYQDNTRATSSFVRPWNAHSYTWLLVWKFTQTAKLIKLIFSWRTARACSRSQTEWVSSGNKIMFPGDWAPAQLLKKLPNSSYGALTNLFFQVTELVPFYKLYIPFVQDMFTFVNKSCQREQRYWRIT